MTNVPTEYIDGMQPCVVARLRCGHYCAGFVIATSILDEIPEFVLECRKRGAEIEIRPVSFIRNGGLTFCSCPENR